MSRSRIWSWLVRFFLAAVLLAAAFAATLAANRRMDRIQLIRVWIGDPAGHPDWLLEAGRRCPGAVMIWPTAGFVGVGWGDGAPPLYRHTGYDIFSPDGQENTTPVFAAHDGYLTREAGWLSTVIIRHPTIDILPADANGEIWTYYTHMASADGKMDFISPDFPPGTFEQYVQEGTLLGYQGTWSGDPGRPVGLHLHFSVVKSLPGGGYRNETRIDNTLDPGLFLGTAVDVDGIIRCG